MLKFFSRKQLYDPDRVKTKNRNINYNINKFIAEFKGDILPREIHLKPEILIPCFNQGSYLKNALFSVCKSSIETTVINDASTDDTPNYIEELKKEFKFKLIQNSVNLNQTGSLNKAIECSTNNLFIVINADDVLLRYTLRTILDLFKRDESIVMVGGGSICFSDEDTLRLNDCFPDNLSYKIHYRIYGPDQAKKYINPNDINMTMSSCSFLKSAWQTVGGFKEFKYRVCSHDDRDFQMRISAFFNVAVIDEPLAFYRVNSSVRKGQL